METSQDAEIDFKQMAGRDFMWEGKLHAAGGSKKGVIAHDTY